MTIDTMKKHLDKIGFDILKRVRKYIEGCRSTKIFVVYGHDEDAKKQLGLILRGWNLTPLFLDQLPSEGRTILEQLEKYISQAKYAIVLITPDDEGHKVGCSEKNKLRPRQNVLYELGMVQAKLGREKVAVLLKESDPPMELPSDIDGLLYIPFKHNVEDAKVPLARELDKAGFSIPASAFE